MLFFGSLSLLKKHNSIVCRVQTTCESVANAQNMRVSKWAVINFSWTVINKDLVFDSKENW